MKTEKMYDFRKKLLAVHECGIRNSKRMAKADEFEIKNGAVIKINENADEVITTAANDFADFLKTTMGVNTVVSSLAEKTEITVALAEDAGICLDDFATKKGFLIKTDEDGIKVYGHDARGAAQGLFYIEDLMTFEKAPVLSFGEIKKKPLFTPQMIHSGYGLDEFPDEYIARIAHEGRDVLLVFVKDKDLSTQGLAALNDIIRRAARYGVDVYAYSKLVSNMSPEAPEAEEFYENSYGKLFRECPGLGGVTLVGESVEFPSKDPHVAKGRYFEIAKDGIPSDKPS